MEFVLDQEASARELIYSTKTLCDQVRDDDEILRIVKVKASDERGMHRRLSASC